MEMGEYRNLLNNYDEISLVNCCKAGDGKIILQLLYTRNGITRLNCHNLLFVTFAMYNEFFN